MTRPTVARVALAIVGGLLAGLSLPPSGLGFLAPVGIALVLWSVLTLTPVVRLVASWLAGCAMFALTLTFAAHFTLVGAVILIAIEALFVAIPLWAAGFTRAPLLIAVFGLIVGEALRQRAPLGGLPIGSLALATAEGPWRTFARVGGTLGLFGFVIAVGAATAWFATALIARAPTVAVLRGGVLVAVMILPIIAGDLAGSALHTTGALSVTCVQGGGRRGLSQFEVDPNTVFGAQATRTNAITPSTPPSIVLWPENTVAVSQPLRQTPQFMFLSSSARRLNATLIAGVRTDLSGQRFLNQAVAIGPEGTIVARVTKVHRVPFGEYVPWRAELTRVVNLAGVPRDAVVGTGPGTMAVAKTTVGILISFETFFTGRARQATRAGATMLLAPTNTASYASDQIPDQQLAAAQLDATATGRALMLCAPTGRSAVIDREGAVRATTPFAKPATLAAMVTETSGETIFDVAGDLPIVVLCAVCITTTLLVRRQS